MARANDLRIGTGAWLRLTTWISVAFLFLPIPVLIIYSFNAGRQVTYWEGFSLKWYAAALADRDIWTGVRNSLLIAVASTAIATVLGTTAALALGKYTFRGRRLFQNLIYVPIILPEIIFGLSLLALFVLVRAPLGFLTITCAHATFSLSFVALIVLAKLHQFDARLEEASLDLGADRWETFWRVVLPGIAPGIVSGAMFAFTLSLDDFVVTLFTAGADSTTLPLRIYSLIRYGMTPELNAVSTVLILVTLGALAAGHHLQGRSVSRRVVLGLGGGMAVVVAGMLLVSTVMSDDDNTLNLYNYAGYIDDEVLAGFQRETGIRINANFYNDNEELLSRMAMGACDYDVVVPSDYMVSILSGLGLLAPIDAANVPNLRYVDPRFRHMPFEPTGTRYVPYAYGCAGISYNSAEVAGPVDSWQILFDERFRGRILMLDDMRECLGLALRLQGHSLANRDPAELAGATQLLRAQRPLVLRYDSNTTSETLLSGEACLAHNWSGTGLRLRQEHPEFGFALPREGVSMFVDCLCIPRDARHKRNAERLLDYLLRPDVAARNMASILYPMPNPEGRRQLPEETAKLLGPIFDMDLARFELIGELGEFNKQVDRAWTELRSE